LSRRSRAYKNVVALQLSRSLSKVVGVFFLAIAARYLGTVGIGQWSLIFLFTGFSGLIADFGVDRLTVRNVARDLGSAGKYLSNTLAFKFLSLIPTTVLLIGVVHYMHYPEETHDLIIFALPLLLLGALASPFGSIIQAHEKIYVLSAVDACQGIITSLIAITLLLLGFGIKSLLVVHIALSGVRLVILIVVTKRLIGRLWYPLKLHFVRSLVKPAFPFAILSILALIHWKVDYFMISKILGEEHLGLYAVAYKVFEIGVVAGATFNAALFPTVSAMYGESKEKLRRAYEKIQNYFVIFSLPVSVLIILFAEEIILLLYGDQYLESVNVLVILGLGFGIFFFTLPMRMVINNSEFIMRLVPYFTITAVLNIVLNLVIIPLYGIIGAALVTFFAGFIDVLVRIMFIRKIFREGTHPVKFVWKPLIAAIAMIALILIFSGVNKYLFAVIGLITYFFIINRMGELGREEYRLFVREPIRRLISSITKS
jgi:O-antigen/teichoic acid export membrane protein